MKISRNKIKYDKFGANNSVIDYLSLQNLGSGQASSGRLKKEEVFQKTIKNKKKTESSTKLKFHKDEHLSYFGSTMRMFIYLKIRHPKIK